MKRIFQFILLMTVILSTLLIIAACDDDDDDDDDDNDTTGDDDDDTADDDDDSEEPFKVGFARSDISPDHSVILAGYGLSFLSDAFCRWSEGVHDPIYATAVAFEHPDSQPVILIHLDVVGAIITDIERIQEQIAQSLGTTPERVLVAASHSHGTPDAVGIWGVLIPPRSGRDDEFIEGMIDGAVQAGIAAYENRMPATLAAAAGIEADMHYNPQHKVDHDAITDDNMTLLAAYDYDGNLIGTLMSWGCHPMVMGPQNKMITADYIGPYYRMMDEELGGINMYVNSSLGATVHPQNPFDPFPMEGNSWGTWEDLDNFGRVLADDAQALIADAQPLQDYSVHLISKTVSGKLENPLFALAGQLDLIPRDMPPLGEYGDTTMSAFSIGPVRFATVPGELVPDLGLQCREIMGGEYQFLITLGMDWLGYIMTEEQYRSIFYIYFSILSVGPTMGDVVTSEFELTFAQWPQ